MKNALSPLFFLFILQTGLCQEKMQIVAISPDNANISIDWKKIVVGETIPYNGKNELVFPDKYSFARGYLINAKKMVWLCVGCGSGRPAHEKGDRLSYLLESMLPRSVPETPASKDMFNLNIEQLQDVLRGGKQGTHPDSLTLNNYYILDSSRLSINTSILPLDEKHYLFCRIYNKDGENYFDKKIASADNIAILDRNLIVRNDKEVDTGSIAKFAIFYYDGTTDRVVSDFKPVFPDLRKLTVELRLVYAATNDLAEVKRKKYVYSYFQFVYGPILESDFENWFKKIK